MHHAKRSERRVIFRHHVALILMVFVLFLPLPSPAQGPVSAKSGEPQRLQFAIPAQDLATGLVQYSDTTKIDLLVDSDLTTSLQTMGVAGEHTSEEALQKMLVGTGLTYRFIDSKTVTLTRDASSGIVPGVIGAAGAGAVASAAGGERTQESGNNTAQKPVVQNGHKPVKVPEIVVKDVRERETAELDNLPPEYAGGQVASGGRMGILGNRNIMDTPFTQMNYTSKLIQDQQARFLGEVLKNDPSVQLAQQTSSGFLTYSIRGFLLGDGDTLFNGLAIAPQINGTMMTESLERVEVLRGPNALLNGGAPGGSIGGMVNLVPKRAGDEALTQLTAQYMSDSQVGGHVDIGRRFGSHKQFGVRINGVYRNGDLPIDRSSREAALATAGLDYRGDIVRFSADFGYQEQEIRGARRQPFVASSVTVLPEPPDTRTNANQPWEATRTRALFGSLRGEIDVTRYITAFADFGITDDRRQSIISNRQIIDSQGTLAVTNPFLIASGNPITTFNAGLRGSFDTGPIHHQTVAAYTRYSRETRFRQAAYAIPASNLYNPVFAPPPPHRCCRITVT